MKKEWKKEKLEEWVSKARAGQPAELFEAIDHYVRKTVRSFVASQDVDDVTQETLQIAFSKLDELKDNTSFTGWIGTIARRTAADHYRSRKHGDVSFEEPMLDPHTETPDGAAEKKEMIEQVRCAIARLPVADQKMVEEYYNGTSMRDISDKLQIPIGTIKRRLSLSRKRLQFLLKD